MVFMKISNILTKVDSVLDLVPVVSSITNLVDIFLKAVVFSKSTYANTKNRYYTHLRNKTYTRCFVLLIPFVGNIIFGIIDFKNKWNKKDLVLEDETMKEKENVIAQVRKNPDYLRSVSAELKDDEDVIYAVSKDSYAFGYASDRLRSKRDFVLKMVAQNGYLLQFALPQADGKSLKDDDEVVSTAVNNNGLALMHAGENMRDNDKIVAIAMKQNAQAIRHASKRLQDILNIPANA